MRRILLSLAGRLGLLLGSLMLGCPVVSARAQGIPPRTAPDAVAPAPPRNAPAGSALPQATTTAAAEAPDELDSAEPTVVVSEPLPLPVPGEEASLEFSDLAAFDNARGLDEGRAERFTWPQTAELGLYARLVVHGDFAEPRRVTIFIAVRGEDGEGPVLFKREEEHLLLPGVHGFTIAGAVTLGDSAGPQALRVHVEARQGNLRPASSDLSVDYAGAPPPAARIESVGLRDAHGLARDIFTAGAEFTVDAQLTAYSNHREPLRALVRTELDCDECARGTGQLESAPALAEYRELPGALGQWRLTAAGRLPEGLPARDSGFLPFRVTVLLLSGQTIVAEASRFAVIRTSGNARDGCREIELDASADWQLALE